MFCFFCFLFCFCVCVCFVFCLCVCFVVVVVVVVVVVFLFFSFFSFFFIGFVLFCFLSPIRQWSIMPRVETFRNNADLFSNSLKVIVCLKCIINAWNEKGTHVWNGSNILRQTHIKPYILLIQSCRAIFVKIYCPGETSSDLTDTLG